MHEDINHPCSAFANAGNVQEAQGSAQSRMSYPARKGVLCVPQKVMWQEVLLLQIIFMTGWAPHASQQRPMQRGSAEVTLESLQAELEKRKASKPAT